MTNIEQRKINTVLAHVERKLTRVETGMKFLLWREARGQKQTDKAMRVLELMIEAFAVDNTTMTKFQIQATRAANRLLMPWHRAQKKARR